MTLWSLSVCLSPTENQECSQHVVNERLGELVRVLKTVIGKHQALNSSEILGAAGTVIAKVKGEHLPSAPPHFRINNLELILSFFLKSPLFVYVLIVFSYMVWSAKRQNIHRTAKQTCFICFKPQIFRSPLKRRKNCACCIHLLKRIWLNASRQWFWWTNCITVLTCF